MCGIIGLISNDKVESDILENMINSIKYRGPDDTGYFISGNVGLGHCRLSIVDPQNGIQPINNEDSSIIIVYNGEIYNHLALREDLYKKGHLIGNNSDGAILPHLYEEYGLGMFHKLNGQFAIAIWDKPEDTLILARDRLGEKPLYYFHENETFCFASEVKAILKSGLVDASISPYALKQTFTFWTTLSNRSIFRNIYQVPQGSYLVLKRGIKKVRAYWELDYNQSSNETKKDIDDLTDELDQRLKSSVQTRMAADVPISFYLSGGLDSSLITGIAARLSFDRLDTFSIMFDDTGYDESGYQNYMSNYLGTNHHNVMFSSKEIPNIIKEVICQTEVPLFRTGAFPMYILSKLVRGNNRKVVLSGEGADELFGGYDIFREVKIREFCRKSPDSLTRALLYKKINNFVSGLNNQSISSLSMFYNKVENESDFSSHLSRWKLGLYSQQFFSTDYREQMQNYNEIKEIEEHMPCNFKNWTPLQRAQYLEIMIFFSNYLLSSQGDRVSMASGVECRYPFLDYEILEFASSLPDNIKIKALNEKYIVKKLASRYLPDIITGRKKFPYRAPINVRELLKDEYIKYILSKNLINKFGIFNPISTERLLTSIFSKQFPSERDGMLFMGILTTQILCDQFVNTRYA